MLEVCWGPWEQVKGGGPDQRIEREGGGEVKQKGHFNENKQG